MRSSEIAMILSSDALQRCRAWLPLYPLELRGLQASRSETRLAKNLEQYVIQIKVQVPDDHTGLNDNRHSIGR